MKRIPKALVWLVLAAMLATATEAASPLKAFVVAVSDGDTVWVRDNGKGPAKKLRLHIEDAVEHDQPYGKEATDFATKKLLNKEVTYLGRGKSYDRTVADIWEPTGKSYALDLAQHGLGWIDTNFHPTRKAPDSEKQAYAELVAAQAKAKADKTGLWKDANPVEPKAWRAKQRTNRRIRSR